MLSVTHGDYLVLPLSKGLQGLSCRLVYREARRGGGGGHDPPLPFLKLNLYCKSDHSYGILKFLPKSISRLRLSRLTKQGSIILGDFSAMSNMNGIADKGTIFKMMAI